MRFGGMRQSILLAAGLLIASALSAGEDTGFWLYKAYAGTIDTRRALARRKALNNVRDGVNVPDATVIQCKVGMMFGVGYLVVPSTTDYAGFRYTWHHPHFLDRDGKTELSHHVALRHSYQRVMGVQFLTWQIEPSEAKDGDFLLEVEDEERLLLRHTFLVRGCRPPAAEASAGTPENGTG